MRHWRGEQGLAWSFWVNFVVLRAVVFAAQSGLFAALYDGARTSGALVLLLIVIFHGIFLVWQTVGVLRASDVHVRATGNMAPVWGAQLGLIFGVFWVLIHIQSAWLTTYPALAPLPDHIAERQANTSLNASSDGLSITLHGPLVLGITRQLDALLDAHPATAVIILHSEGGNIYAARGLSQKIRQRGLNTRVDALCSSACTTVFMGGVKRRLGPAGRLGFHQYRIHADYVVLNADPRAEQDKDRAHFIRFGAADWFVEEMFAAPASDMWFPDNAELLAAGVTTGE